MGTYKSNNKNNTLQFADNFGYSVFEKIFFLLPAIFATLFIIIPTFIILCVSLCKSKLASPPFTNICSLSDTTTLNASINFGNYVALFSDSYYMSALLSSLLLSIMVTILTVMVGFFMAYSLYNMRNRWQKIFITLIYISFWTSFLIRIYSWMNLLGKNGVINNLLIKCHIISLPIQFIGNKYAVYFGMVFCYLPFVILPIHAHLKSIDYIYVEAAYDLGYSPLKTFWKIMVPLSRNSIITSCFFVFSMSIGEFSIPELLGNSSILTFGKVLWNEFFVNLDWPMACAISVFVVIAVLLPAYLIQSRFKGKL